MLYLSSPLPKDNEADDEVVMEIDRDRFFSAASDLKIPEGDVEALWTALETRGQAVGPTPFAKYLFYFGAMIVISAMTWFMSSAWETFGGGGMFLIATAYALVLTAVGAFLWNKKELKTPAGLLITIAVCMVPLAIYGLETYFNIWPSDQPDRYRDFYSFVEGRWVSMEIGTILAALLALRFFPFPFLTAPLFFSIWFLTMDLAPLLLGQTGTWNQKCWISLVLGLLIMAIGFILDKRKNEGYAFWSYFFGTLSFWGALNCLVWNEGETVLIGYLLINVLMMCLSIALRRPILMVFGALGCFAYFSHLAYDVFENSILFPFLLSFLGLATIYLGIVYQRNSAWLEGKVQETLPASWSTFLGPKPRP